MPQPKRKREPRNTPPGVKPSPRKPKRISAQDLEYHAELIAKGAKVQEAYEEFYEANPWIRGHEASWNVWGEHLFKKYGLSENDRIEMTGEITRG